MALEEGSVRAGTHGLYRLYFLVPSQAIPPRRQYFTRVCHLRPRDLRGNHHGRRAARVSASLSGNGSMVVAAVIKEIVILHNKVHVSTSDAMTVP